MGFYGDILSSGYVKIAIEHAHRNVDFPMKNGGSFHCLLYVHQRVRFSIFENSELQSKQSQRIHGAGILTSTLGLFGKLHQLGSM